MDVSRIRRPSPQTIAVLAALADGSETWSYGYELCRSLDLKAGTVYPILIRLAERGMVETAWESEAPTGRPARHLYRLSPSGAELVADLRRAEKAVKPSFTEVME
jgi:DNA-binding PadR family transcriptional regulator